MARARTPRWLLAGDRPAGRLLGQRGGGVERSGRASEGNKWREAAFDAAVHRRWKECDRNRVDMADRPTDRRRSLSLSFCAIYNEDDARSLWFRDPHDGVRRSRSFCDSETREGAAAAANGKREEGRRGNIMRGG